MANAINKIFDMQTNGFTWNKDNIRFMHRNYLLSKVITMFEYEGLPETLPQYNLEDILLRGGHCRITHVDVKETDVPFESGLYALHGNGGGEPNPYYYPTQYVVANPFLNISKTYTIGNNNVLAKNTSFFFPLLPLIEYTAHQLTENETTLNVAMVNTRIMTILTANDSTIAEACKKYMENIKNGELSFITDNRSDFLDGVKTHPYASTGNSNVITQILETEQYLKGSFYNEIGLNANYNMKRESINGNEAGLNEDGLTPLIVDMLNCRKKMCEDVNKTFGTNWSVKLSPVFKKNLEIASKIPEDETNESEVVEENGTTEN